MKNANEFAKNQYTERQRLKKDKHQWLKDNFRKLGFISGAALLDNIIENYIKPNLFTKQKGKKR